jgi:hypothetical protein
MPDITNTDLHTVLTWFVTGAGLIFYATFLHGVLERARNDYTTKLHDLSSTWMLVISIVAFFVPVGIAQAILNYAPPSFYDVVDPWLRVLSLAALIYSGQQWLHWTTKQS